MTDFRSCPDGSIGELIGYLAPHVAAGASPVWPPDAFGIAAYVLHRSGAYVRVIEPSAGLINDEWPETAVELGAKWRAAIEEAMEKHGDLDSATLPAQVSALWDDVKVGANIKISELMSVSSSTILAALIKICAAADEACVGVGIAEWPEGKAGSFLELAERELGRNSFCSLCMKVSTEKLCVLPKKHTPQRGLTIRSLTHHLALRPANGLRAQWIPPYSLQRPMRPHDEVMNLLLFPWPNEINPATAFQVVNPSPAGLPSGYGLFRYHRSMDDKFEKTLRDTVDRARTLVGEIHGVIMPELALTIDEYTIAEQLAINKKIFLVAGVSEAVYDGKMRPANICKVQLAGLATGASTIREMMEVSQHKHHRWCLDRNQVLQYGLGGRLPAARDLWEDTRIGVREIAFLNPSRWLTLSVLICEDLARQDPAAETIRAVGPNLLIALLMDAPQLRERWPARYASILAEDPGCSVLTLTSRGMADLSRPTDETTQRRSQVLALWRDAPYGQREIEILPESAGCVLSLACHERKEYSVDGRPHAPAANFPVFAGIRQVPATD